MATRKLPPGWERSGDDEGPFQRRGVTGGVLSQRHDVAVALVERRQVEISATPKFSRDGGTGKEATKKN